MSNLQPSKSGMSASAFPTLPEVPLYVLETAEERPQSRARAYGTTSTARPSLKWLVGRERAASVRLEVTGHDVPVRPSTSSGAPIGEHLNGLVQRFRGGQEEAEEGMSKPKRRGSPVNKLLKYATRVRSTTLTFGSHGKDDKVDYAAEADAHYAYFCSVCRRTKAEQMRNEDNLYSMPRPWDGKAGGPVIGPISDRFSLACG